MAVLTAVGALALAPVADGANRKVTGRTSQDRPAFIWVNEAGTVTLVSVRYRARCRRSGARAGGRMYYRDNQRLPFKRSGARFSDGGKLKERVGRRTVVMNTKMTGRPRAGGGWQGRFWVTQRWYNRSGKRVDFCRTGVVRWAVR